MALTTPILSQIGSFDATDNYVFSFVVNGGDVVVSNTLEIYNDSTNALVYSNTQSTYKEEHSLPQNTTVNGVKYRARLKTSNSSGQFSEWSNDILFYCYSAPILNFINPPSVITTPQINIKAEYFQNEDEMLKYYVFNLYNLNNTLISTSQMFENELPATETVINYTFGGLNNGTYKIECVGYTITNTLVTSSKHQFVVNSSINDDESFIVTNNHNNGCIDIESNMDVIGFAKRYEIDYLNDEVSLLGDNIRNSYPNNYVDYDGGFQLDEEFTFSFWFRDVYYENSKLHDVQFKSGTGSIETSNGLYTSLTKSTNFNGYVFQLPKIIPPSGYKFDHWEDSQGNIITSTTIYEADTVVTAQYIAE